VAVVGATRRLAEVEPGAGPGQCRRGAGLVRRETGLAAPVSRRSGAMAGDAGSGRGGAGRSTTKRPEPADGRAVLAEVVESKARALPGSRAVCPRGERGPGQRRGEGPARANAVGLVGRGRVAVRQVQGNAGEEPGEGVERQRAVVALAEWDAK